MKPNKRFSAEVDWNSVRGIYKKLSEEFHVLTDAFQVTVNDDLKQKLDYLIIAIDEVDNSLDELEPTELRNSLSAEMIAFLGDNKKLFSHPQADDVLQEKLNSLKGIIGSLEVKNNFIEATENILKYTELKRHTKDSNELIDFVLKEGEATAELPLSIIGKSSNKEFRVFFIQLCEIMGIVDLIFDLRSDYKKKIVSIRPNFKIYFKLLQLSFSKSLSLFRAFPKKLTLIKYCMKFAFVLMTE